jgi:predicted nuclease of restriction endonuclease-like (RecB) superfamily
VESARRFSARSVNAVMTATYWEIGRRIVEVEQRGKKRAEYGEALLKKLASDLTARFGKGFGLANLKSIRKFFLTWPEKQIGQTLSGQSASQISSQFYERTSLSRNKTAMLKKSSKTEPGDLFTPEEEIKDPFVLEFLGLKDEYSESDLEEALILHLEAFLLELGGEFAFVARQRRLRIGDEWYRVDLLFFHRKLRCLVVIDLKLGRFNHADVGQMHLYLNYAKEHWVHEGENPPVGVILCAQKDEAVAHYALEGLVNKVLAREYLTVLPSEKALVQEIEKARREIES